MDSKTRGRSRKDSASAASSPASPPLPTATFNAMVAPPSSFDDNDFRRLHGSVRPNPLSFDAFRCVVTKGLTSSHFSAQAMQKLASTARDILQEQGRLAESVAAHWRGTKAEISQRLMAATMPKAGLKPREVVKGPSTSADPFTSYSSETFYPKPTASESLQQPSAPLAQAQSVAFGQGMDMPSTIPKPTLRNPITFVTPALVTSSPVTSALSSSGHHGTLPLIPPPAAVPHSTTFWNLVAALCNQSPCVAGYRPYCSSLQPIFQELKRGALRSGCLQMQFEIPLEHLNDVISRKTRVLVVPISGGYTPSAWPKELKDLYLYVNGESFTTRWRRSWSRKDLATSYLPIDITMSMDKKKPMQRLQFDCLAKEFMCSVAVVLAHQVSEIDLAEKLAEGFIRPHDLAVMYRRWAEVDETARATEDEDDVIEATAVPITTVCPISRGRLNIPIRGVNCKHIQPINLAPYLRTAHTGCFFNCPKCDAPLRGDDLVIDGPLMKGLRDLSIPRTWQYLQLQRRPGCAAPPVGRLLPQESYQWVRWSKDVDVNGVGSDDESDTASSPKLSLSATSKTKSMEKSAPREVITLD